jgi:hypothetical protein
MNAKYLLTILIFSSFVFARNNSGYYYCNKAGETAASHQNTLKFEIGIRDEFYTMFLNFNTLKSTHHKSDIRSSYWPFNLHLTTGLEFLNTYKIYIKSGIALVYDDFGGFDGGIFGDIKLTGGFWISTGIDFFSVSSSGHGTFSNSADSYLFYCIGAGYHILNNFKADITYYIPDKKVLGHNAYYEVTENEGMLGFGFEYIFSF